MDNNTHFQPATENQIKDTRNIDGQDLKALIAAALAWLKANQQYVNSLNVFPVPDGDTGTNMVLTLQAALNEIAGTQETNIGKIAHQIAQGALMGARGNSGVILSQLLRGFARTLDNYEIMNAQMLVEALNEARTTAYKGVVRPVEGTILTVAKDISIEASQAVLETDDMLIILEKITQAGEESVKRTPDLLPILKQANVVDAGGKGLVFILEGILRFLKGMPLDMSQTIVQPLSVLEQAEEVMETIEPGQDYEVVIDFKPISALDLDMFYNRLTEIGTSIQMGEGDGMYRMHIHVPTEKRYEPIDYVMSLGTITRVQIENLIDQMSGSGKKPAPPQVNLAQVEEGQIAVVAVSPGLGLSRIFASLGAAAIVEGGQTMNPSTEEILKSFKDLPTDKVIILPNNKNIIMTAQTAASASDKQVAVIPSRSIPQGLSAILHLIPDGNFDQVVKNMNNALKDVSTGEITYATRDAVINGVQVKEGSFIAMLDGKLVEATDTLEKACLGMLSQADIEDKERITLFYGNNINGNEVDQITNMIKSRYPKHEIELHEGGQPYYHFIIALE